MRRVSAKVRSSSASAAELQGSARAGDAKLQRHSFPYLSRGIPILIQPEFCSGGAAEHASFNFTNAASRPAAFAWEKPPTADDSAGFNYAACEGFHVIK